MPGAEPFASDPPDSREIGIVLSHGITGTPQSMRPWGEYLAAQGFGVRGPRLPGHGTRWQDLNRTRWTDWYGELSRAVDDLAGQYRSVFVFGLSMGGTLTLRAAQEYGDAVEGIALVNPSVTTLRKDAKVLPYLTWLIPYVPAVANDIAKPGSIELAYDRLPTKGAASLVALWSVVRPALGEIHCPVLLFHSPTDHVVEPVNAAIVRAELGSDDVTDVVLENSHHVATLDHDAPMIFTESAAFVRRVHAARHADTATIADPAADPAGSTPGTTA